MTHKTVNEPPFLVVGQPLRVSMRNGENFHRIPEFWRQCALDGTLVWLADHAVQSILPANMGVGVCTDFSPEMDEFTYVIGAEWAGGAVRDGFVEIPVPASTWAVFDANGPLPNSIQSVWSKLWPEFMNTTKFQHANGPELEVYPFGDIAASDYRCEVWIPVQEG